MHTSKMYLVIVILLLIACNNNTGKVEEKESTVSGDSSSAANPINTSDAVIGGCYTQVFKRDTANLQIEVKQNNVTGPLSYKLYEKDLNDGSIIAVVEDSIINGWYLFRSEGVLSVRQVAWRIKPGQLWPAMGEVIQRNDTTMFARPDKLQFDSSMPFVKIKCVL